MAQIKNLCEDQSELLYERRNLAYIVIHIIDDVRLPKNRSQSGWPILFTNPLIRKMFNLANAGNNYVFFDLGSGYGQNLRILVTEFDVKRAFEIENLKTRVKKSRKRILKRKLQNRIKIVKGKFEDLLGNNISELDSYLAKQITYP